MNANSFIYTRTEDGDLVAVNAAHIVSLTYDGDALTLNIGADELMTFDGEAALELLKQLIPDAATEYDWNPEEEVAKIKARLRDDAGSARPLDVDEERTQLIALLDDIERVEGCCRYLIRREDGDMIHSPDVANAVVNAHAKLVEIVERAQDTFGFFEDRTAANEQDGTDVDGDELETMRYLQSAAYDLAAVVFNEMRRTRGGARARADVLMAQGEGLLYDYLADAAAAFDDPEWDKLRERITLDELYAAISAAEKRMIQARRLYFNAGDWNAVQRIAREVLESLIALAPEHVPFAETARILRHADEREDGRAAAVNGIDADKRDAALVTDSEDGRAAAVNGIDADKRDAVMVTDNKTENA